MTKPTFPVHSYPWYVHDWRQSMMRLRLPALGRYIYRELLDQCYIDGNFPDEPEVLARIVDVPLKEFNRLWPLVSKAFELRDDGCWHHSKADAVLGNIAKWKEKQSLAGKASGKSRRENSELPLNQRSTVVQPTLNEAPTDVEVSSTSTSTSTTTRTERVVVVGVQCATTPTSNTISDDDPVFPDTHISQSNTGFLSGQNYSGQALDQLARDLVNRLMAKHWTANNYPTALGRLERILSEAVHPERTAAAIEANHASWAAWHAANRKERKKRLEYWLADGDYLHPVSGYAAAPAIPVIDGSSVVNEELSDEELAALDAQRVQERLQEALRA